eukprot:778966_1
MNSLIRAAIIRLAMYGVKYAFIASFLSITASTLSYLIERDSSDTRVVEYYLSTECSKRTERDLDLDVDDIDQQGLRMTSHTKHGEIIPTEEPEDDDGLSAFTISKEEKGNLIGNRGRTLALTEHLSQVFGISPKNLEIGHSMLTKYGVITHVIHFVYSNDLEAMEQDLLNEKH